MGTRSTYRIIEEFKHEGEVIQNEICLVYFQYDGYPDGHPVDTAEWLASGKVVNGIGYTDELIFNGAGCLAAQFIAKYKRAPGGVYLYPLKLRGRVWDEYSYDIIVNVSENTIKFVAYEINVGENVGENEGENEDEVSFNEFFSGSPSEFVEKYK